MLYAAARTALKPVLVTQANYLRRTALELPEADGPRVTRPAHPQAAAGW